jgi:hypothetical protein
MMGIFDSNNVYTTVKSEVKPFKESPVDEFRMFQDQLEAQKMRQVQEHNDRLMAENNARLEEQRIRDIANKPMLLENAKRIAMANVVNNVPNYLLGEAFAEIYLEALPHEHQYIMDNYNAFHKMAHMYIRKIGGMKHLAEQARVTGSPFLKNLYRIVDEASKKIIKDRNKKAAKAISEEEVKEMVSPKPSDEERAKLIKKIDSLGADELAELVNQKVVDVVNDERRKEKETVELQTIMHNELNDDSLTADGISSGSEELDDKTEMPKDDEDRDFEETNKKDANRRALKESYDKWDPIRENFTYNPHNEQQSYFRSLLKNISEGMIMESVGNTNRRDPKDLLNNPLNLNIFESYMHQKPRKSSNEAVPVAENVTMPEISKERVYSEALAQYTLIEAAHTMRLVDITPVDVARQSKFLATEYIK